MCTFTLYYHHSLLYTILYITNLVCYTYFHWFFNPECQPLVWPYDVESFQGSMFCLFVMAQPWNIGVCWIDQVFVTELTVVIFFCSSLYSVLHTSVSCYNISELLSHIFVLEASIILQNNNFHSSCHFFLF
jgi:hypothetical protein